MKQRRTWPPHPQPATRQAGPKRDEKAPPETKQKGRPGRKGGPKGEKGGGQCQEEGHQSQDQGYQCPGKGSGGQKDYPGRPGCNPRRQGGSRPGPQGARRGDEMGHFCGQGCPGDPRRDQQCSGGGSGVLKEVGLLRSCVGLISWSGSRCVGRRPDRWRLGIYVVPTISNMFVI